MKNAHQERGWFLTFLSCFLLNLGLTVGAIFCPVTAFELPVNGKLLWAGLVLLCFLTALLYRYRYAGWAALALWTLAFGGLLIWGRSGLTWGVRTAYTEMTAIYQAAYDFLALPVWSPPGSGDCTILFLLWGGVLAFVNAWVIWRRQSALPALLLDALPLALCMVVVDTPPDLWCLLLILAAACLLLLSQGSRNRNARVGGYLTLGLALPVLALVVLLCVAIPPSEYSRSQSAEQMLQRVLNWAVEVFPLELDHSGQLRLNLEIGGSASQDVDLRMGPRHPNRQPVMEVLAEQSGPVYLRGQTYGTYTPSSWKPLPESAYEDCTAPEEGLLWRDSAVAPVSMKMDNSDFVTVIGGIQTQKTELKLSIRTRTFKRELYTPYYLPALPAVGEAQLDTGLRNTERLREYQITYWDVDVPDGPDLALQRMLVEGAATWDPYAWQYDGYDDFVLNGDAYTALPEETREALLEIARDAGLTEIPRGSLPQAVAEFVCDSARYDLNTEQIPRGEDFAPWFLENSDTGYCVHFATAAAALLRALHVPARFVSGYLVEAEAGTWTTVTEDNAHAWVEYYYPGAGWLILEATPSTGVEATMRRTEEVPETEPSKPPVTDPTEQISGPTELPDSSRHQEENETEPASVRRNIRAWIFWGLAVAVLLVLYRPAVLAVRRRREKQNDPNQALLYRWSLTCRLARQIRQTPPESLEALALKARFSQHMITEAELRQILDWEAELQRALERAPLWRRLYCKWILVLI